MSEQEEYKLVWFEQFRVWTRKHEFSVAYATEQDETATYRHGTWLTKSGFKPLFIFDIKGKTLLSGRIMPTDNTAHFVQICTRRYTVSESLDALVRALRAI